MEGTADVVDNGGLPGHELSERVTYNIGRNPFAKDRNPPDSAPVLIASVSALRTTVTTGESRWSRLGITWLWSLSERLTGASIVGSSPFAEIGAVVRTCGCVCVCVCVRVCVCACVCVCVCV
jgi:hypothetical protein